MKESDIMGVLTDLPAVRRRRPRKRQPDFLILRSRRSRPLEGRGLQSQSHPSGIRPVARPLGSDQVENGIIMSAKEVKFGVDARDRMLRRRGYSQQRGQGDARPEGRNVVLDKSFGAPASPRTVSLSPRKSSLTTSSRTWARRWCAKSPPRRADRPAMAHHATWLAAAIVREGAKSVAAGMNPMDLKRGIDLAVAAVVADLVKNSRRLPRTRKSPRSAPSPPTAMRNGKFLADAMKKVGNEGVITVEEAKSLETELEVVEGMQFDRGLYLALLRHQRDKMRVEMDDVYILIYEKKLSSLNELLPLLEAIVQTGKPLVIVAEDAEGEALAHLVVKPSARRPQGCLLSRLRASAIAARRCCRHRSFDRRSGDLGRSRHQAREVTLAMLGRAKEGDDRQGEHHHRQSVAGKKADIEATRQSDQGADRGNHLGLRP